MADEEELISPQRSLRGRRLQVAAIVFAVVLLGALVTARFWPPSARRHVAAIAVLSSPAPSPAAASAVPWPTSPGACSADGEVPIVSNSARTGGPDIAVLLGGDRPATVNLRTGRRAAVAEGRLRPGEYISALTTAPGATDAVVTRCSGRSVRILRIEPDGATASRQIPGSVTAVLSDRHRLWLIADPRSTSGRGYLTPERGGSRTALPRGFFPEAMTDGVVVGSSMPGGSVRLVDAASGRLIDNLGAAMMLAAGNGEIVWSDRCDRPLPSECALHRRLVRSGEMTTYPLPRPAGGAHGTLSPDGDSVAFLLERGARDPRFDNGQPIPPSQIAVFDLRFGVLWTVPGIEVPAETAPSMVFSGDSQWLIVAVNAGGHIRVLAWRAGLVRPFEAAPVPGQAVAAPPVAVADSG